MEYRAPKAGEGKIARELLYKDDIDGTKLGSGWTEITSKIAKKQNTNKKFEEYFKINS